MRTAAESRRVAADLALIVGVALVASIGLWNGPGILNTRAGGDSPFLLQRVYELTLSLREGVFPARWMPDAAYGLGYPFFNFYAALPYYLAAGLNVVGVDLFVAIKLTQTAGMLAAGLSGWVWLRGRLTGAGPLVGALAYLLAPFHLVNVYVRGDSLSEFYAFIFFPLILMGIERVKANARGRDVFGLALAIAALLVTHNVSAMLFAPFCALYTAAAVFWPGWRGLDRANDSGSAGRAVRALAVAVAIGLALSAWFWLPALVEAPAAQLNEQTTGFFNFAAHFRGPNLIQRSLAFDYAGAGDTSPFAMGLVQALAILLGVASGVAIAVRRRVPAVFLIVCLGGAGLATLMISPLSYFIWDAFPPLELAQFPWRFLSVQAVFGAALTGFVGSAHLGRRAQWFAGGGVALALAAAVFAALPADRLNIVSADVNRASLERYEWLSGNIGTTIRAEYLPAAVVPRPQVGPDMVGQDRARALSGSLVEARRISAAAAGQVWEITVGQGGARVALPLLYWNAWEARAVDAGGAERAVAVTPAPRLGWASVELPAGKWNLAVRYAPTPAQRVGGLLSVLALLAFLIWCFRDARAAAFWRRLRWTLVALIGVLTVGWALTAAAPVPAGVARFVDYTDRPFAHRGPIAVDAGPKGQFVLEAADIGPAEVAAGEWMTVTLRWRAGSAPSGLILEQVAPSHGLGGWPLATQVFRFEGAQVQFERDAASIRILDAMPAGPSLFRLLRQTPGGAIEYVGAVVGPRIVARASAVNAPPLRSFAPALPIALTAFGWRETNPGRVCLFPTWVLTDGDAPFALKYSLRLRGPDGRILAQVDQEPLLGFAPVWSWSLGVPIRDGACDVSLAAGLKPGDPFEVEIVWYDATTIEQVARTTLRGQRLPDLPAANVADPSWATGIP